MRGRAGVGGRTALSDLAYRQEPAAKHGPTPLPSPPPRGGREFGPRELLAISSSGSRVMALWRRDGFAEDSWTVLADDAPAPPEGAIVVSLKRWLAEGEKLTARTAPVGVAVEAGADAQAHL